MGVFPSRMHPDQLAKAKSGSSDANHYNELATAANGHEVTSVEKRRARDELVRAVGEKRANQLQEAALQRAGARPKGIRRLIG